MKLKELAKFGYVGADLVEEFFPKGECKERGKAIVLYAKLLIALGNIEIDLQKLGYVKVDDQPKELKDVLEEMEKGFQASLASASSFNDRKYAKNMALAQIQKLGYIKVDKLLTKDEFRHILCEFPPSIAEDSGQPEWTQGEMDRVWDFITGKNKFIPYEMEGYVKMSEIGIDVKKINSILLHYFGNTFHKPWLKRIAQDIDANKKDIIKPRAATK